MPRFYFDTTDTGLTLVDDEGLDCRDREAARREAVSALPYMALDALPDGDRRDFAVQVRDETGRVVLKASLVFSAAWLDPEEE